MNYHIPIIKLSMVKDRTLTANTNPRRSITQSTQAASICRAMIGECDREQFICLHLDAKHHIIAVETIATGSLTMALVHPREVFKAAILSNSAAIIVAHNHPSGNPEPSEEDFTLTRRLVEAGKILGVPILDHIVIGEETSEPNRYYSFADEGVLTLGI